MSMLDEILENNSHFLRHRPPPLVGHAPRKRAAVVTCMDCRLVQMFEHALGLERGDVVELRTAGATISAPERQGGGNDLIRSLAGAIYLLGVREVLVIGHTQCGLSHVDPVVVTSSMEALGVDPRQLIKQQHLKDEQGLVNWLGAFSDVHLNVKEVVQVIRTSPFLPRIPVSGLVIDINTGELTLVERG
jgi:carbonic anhydrase